MAIQTITFRLCSNPTIFEDFDVDTSIVTTGRAIFADYECWESTGSVGSGPTGTVMITGYDDCSDCIADYNTWEFTDCNDPLQIEKFSFPNGEIWDYFANTGATISFNGICYEYTTNFEVGTGTTTQNFTVSDLINNGLYFDDCAECQLGPSPTPTPHWRRPCLKQSLPQMHRRRNCRNWRSARVPDGCG